MLKRIITLSLVAAIASLVFGDQAGAFVSRWAPASLTAVANGSNTTCAIASDKVYCWGSNSSGQLGIGSTDGADHPLPLKVIDTGALAGKSVTSVTVGYGGYVCVIASNWPYCWGTNTFGALGNNTTTDSNIPVAVVDANGVLTGKTITHISTGFGHACVIADAKPYCWGSNSSGSLGDGSTTSSLVPVAVASGGALSGVSVTSIALGSSHTCVSGATGSVGRVYCWGNNVVGQLGNGTTTESHVPVAVSTTAGELLTGDVLSVATGGANLNTCALTKPPARKIYCWGFGSSGQLGSNNTGNALVPVAVVQSSGALQGKSITTTYVGKDRACALDTTGRAYCWGAPRAGNNTTAQQNVPVAVLATGVLNGINLQGLAAGSNACGVGANSRLYCWGDNVNGQLGDNTITARNAPVEVLAQGEVTNSNYRLYEYGNLNAPLAANSTPGQLTYTGQPFRLRMGVRPLPNSNPANHIDIRVSDTLKLQFAERTEASCSAQSSGFSDVSTSSKIAWQPAGFGNGTAISAHPNDPGVAGTMVPQKQVSGGTSFTPVSPGIYSGQTGLWDFSLYDNGMTHGARYCLRIVHGDGLPLEGALVSYPEVASYTGEEISVSFVNDAGIPAASALTFPMAPAPWSASCRQVLGNMLVAGGQSSRIRVFSGNAVNGWTVSIAATDGPGASWSTLDGTRRYDFNESNGSPAGCSPGLDGDSLAGALEVWMLIASLRSASGCASSAVSLGATAQFDQGSQDALTIISGAPGSPTGCYWDVSNIYFRQQIPAHQPPGEYSIDMTISAVAS